MSYLFEDLYGNKIENKEYRDRVKGIFQFSTGFIVWLKFFSQFLALETVKNELEQKNVFASCTIWPLNSQKWLTCNFSL